PENRDNLRHSDASAFAARRDWRVRWRYRKSAAQRGSSKCRRGAINTDVPSACLRVPPHGGDEKLLVSRSFWPGFSVRNVRNSRGKTRPEASNPRHLKTGALSVEPRRISLPTMPATLPLS